MSVHPAPKPTPKPLVAIDLGHDDPKTDHTVVIRWKIARRALRDLAPQGQSTMVHLELTISDPTHPAWALIDPKSTHRRAIDPPTDPHPPQPPQPPQPTPMRITHTANEIVIESAHLCAHIRISDREAAELVYVRTDIFCALNIEGGRYEPIGCSIQHQ